MNVSTMTDAQIKDFLRQPATAEQREAALVLHGEIPQAASYAPKTVNPSVVFTK